MKFETLHKLKALNSMVTIFFVILEACQYWHLSCFGPQFYTKNSKSFNLDEILLFTQTESGKLNGGNSFFVIDEGCQHWYVLSFRPQFSTKNGQCSSYDETLFSAQNEGGEFNGFDIEICKWVPQRIKTWNRKTNLVSKILLLHYKQNW